jgi:hypothetical protein
MMKKMFVFFMSLALLGVASAADKGNKNEEALALFEFNQLTTVVAPFTGTASPIRGIAGGGTPWQIASGKAELSATGELEVHVHGLVLVSSGVNPVANFSFILSCQSVDAAGAPVFVNLVPGTAPATTTGDANFEGAVRLPSPCIAPIVFVAAPSANGARWLAISGF